jgi:hypothetical protein
VAPVDQDYWPTAAAATRAGVADRPRSSPALARSSRSVREHVGHARREWAEVDAVRRRLDLREREAVRPRAK